MEALRAEIRKSIYVAIGALCLGMIFLVIYSHSSSSGSELMNWLKKPISELKAWELLLIMWFTSAITSK